VAVDFKDYIVVFGDKDEVTEEPPCGLWYLKEEFRGFELMRQKDIRDIYDDESNFVFNGGYVQGLPYGQSFTEGAKYNERFWSMKRDLKNGYTFIPLIQKSLDSVKGSQFFNYLNTNDGKFLEDKVKVLVSGYYLDKYGKTYSVELIVQCIKELSVLGISGTLTSVRELLDNGYDKDQVIGWHLAKVMDVLDWEEQSVQSQVNLYKKETLDYNRWLKILNYIKAKKKLYETDMSSSFNLDFGNSAQNNIDSIPVDLTSPRYQGTKSQYINVFLRMSATKVELLYRIDSVLKFNELLPVERFILSKQLTTNGYGQVDNKFLEGKVVRKVYKTFVTDLYAVSHRDSSSMKVGASKEVLSRESEMLEELKLKQSPWSLQDVFVNVTGGPDKVRTIVREMFPKYGQCWEIGIHDMPLSFRMFSQNEGDRLNVPPNEIKLRVKSIPQLHDIIESVRGQFGPGEIAYEFDGGRWTVSELAVIICYRIMFDIDTLAIL